MTPLLILALISFPIKKSPHPDPTRAALYSLAFPGLGEYYTGNSRRALVISSIAAFFLGKAGYHLYWYKYYRNQYLSTGFYTDKITYENQFRAFMSSVFWYIGVWGFSMVDSYISAHLSRFTEINANIDREFERP